MSYATHHASATRDVRIGILTISDTKGPATDQSGDTIQHACHRAGLDTKARLYSRDEPGEILTRVQQLAAMPIVDAIITTGGTGVSPRDVTIESVRPLLEPELPGFGEVFRLLSFERIQSGAILSRATAGVLRAGGQRKPIFLLPGSPEACELAVEKIIVHELGHLVELANGGHHRHA